MSGLVLGHVSAADAALGLFVLAVLAVLSWHDVRERVIPNRIVLPSWALVLALQFGAHPERWREWLAASFGAALFFLVPALVFPAGLGMGDVKLAGLIGAALGHHVFAGLVIGVLCGGLWAGALLLLRGFDARRTTLPYGPFLAAGAAVVLLL
jgi:leader peptidase (prepilin peptidase)/N-methyltransferase